MLTLTMLEDPPLETARQRAERIWRNHMILQQLAITDDIDKIIENDKRRADEKRMNQIRARITNEIRKIMAKRNNINLHYYLLSIQAQKRKLLTEKLRRLQENRHE